MIDVFDLCPNSTVGAKVDKDGCEVVAPVIDTDKDGVEDKKDLCPNTVAGTKVDKDGCEVVAPVIDTDKDGLEDAKDLCPNTASGTKVDKDGVEDSKDLCSDTLPKVKVDKNGCEIKKYPITTSPKPDPSKPQVGSEITDMKPQIQTNEAKLLDTGISGMVSLFVALAGTLSIFTFKKRVK